MTMQLKVMPAVLGFIACYAIIPEAHAEAQTLQQAWIQAYQSNPSLEAERAKLRTTDEQVSQALSHWRPSIDATSNVGKNYQNIPAQSIFGTDHFADTIRGYGAQITQPIFRGFRTEAETESAEKQILAGRAQLESAEQKLFLDTAKAFLDTVRDEAVLLIDTDNEDVLRKKLDETRVRARVGELTQTDVSQAESRLARAEASRLQTEYTLASDRAAYARLIGEMPGTLQAPDLTLSDHKTLEDVLSLAKDQNPDIRAAQYAMESAKAEIELAQGSLLPEINLVGSTSRNWGQSSTVPGREDNNQIIAQLTIPLYRSGADYSRTRAAQQTRTQRRMELEDARHKAHESCYDAWKSFEASEATIKADQAEIDAAMRALEGVKIQSKVGTRTTLDVLNAEQELLDAKTDMAKSQHDKAMAILQIRAAIGELTATTLKLPIGPYDPKRHYDDVRDQWFGFSEDDETYAVKPQATHEPVSLVAK